MGSVVTVGMFIGLVYALLRMGSKYVHRLPMLVHNIVGATVALAGAWNVFWYASRHITQLWGGAALVSGIALMLTGTYIVKKESAPVLLQKLMPVVLLLLFGCMMLYGITIYRI